jgi:hypothetical protein
VQLFEEGIRRGGGTVCIMMLASLSDRRSTGRNVSGDGDTIRFQLGFHRCTFVFIS